MISANIQVRGFHCDAYGHVNNARYLEFLEQSRWTFLQPAIDKQFFQSRGLLFVVVNINIRYRKAIFPNEWIKVNVESCQFERKTISLDQSIYRGEENCADAVVKFVLLDTKTNKPVDIDDPMKDLFHALLEGHA